MRDNEVGFCSKCRHDLPLMDHSGLSDDPVERILHGRVDLTAGTALLRFEKKSIVQNMLHNLKYRGLKEISAILGSWLGQKISQDQRFSDIDMVVPVPLHPAKLRKRGYNQVALFGKEIANRICAEYVDDLLLKTKSTPTKVFQSRLNRWQSGQSAFTVHKPERLHNKSVLLVDDIITTGATLEACASSLKIVPGLKISVATMAIAD